MSIELTKVYPIPIDDIKPQGINVRSDLDSAFSQEKLQELADSIDENGLMQPIVLEGTYGSIKAGEKYDIVVGQRRFLAHKLLKRKFIDATFTGNIDKTQAIILSLSENLLRQEMNRVDIMNAVTKLYHILGNNEHEVKKKLGLSIRTIRDYINVKDQATPKMIRMLEEEKLSLTDAKRVILAAQGDVKKADSLVEAFSDKKIGFNQYNKKRAVEYAQSNPKATTKEIIENAKKPKIEETVILNFSLRIYEALEKAASKFSSEKEDVIMNLVTDWLKTNEFLES